MNNLDRKIRQTEEILNRLSEARQINPVSYHGRIIHAEPMGQAYITGTGGEVENEGELERIVHNPEGYQFHRFAERGVELDNRPHFSRDYFGGFDAVEGIQAGEGILAYIDRVGIMPVNRNSDPTEYTIMTGMQGAQEMNAALDEIISREFGEYTWKIKSQKRPEEPTENKSFLDNVILDDNI